jgi:hypothetical protein
MIKEALVTFLAASATASSGAVREGTPAPGAAELEKMTARFAPVEVGADIAALGAQEQLALAKIIDAAKLMDSLFLRQVWAGNEPLLLELSQDHSPLGKSRLHAFVVNKGPWSRLDKNSPFIPGVPAKPGAGNFYPPGSTREEIERWLKSLDEAARAQAAGFFTVIRWAPGTRRDFQIVPYALEYQPELHRAGQLLEEAAVLTAYASLREFLSKRARAFLTNDYYESDLAWMQIDGSIEPTIGPYEVYEDDWFNAKSAFEAVIGVRDEAETQKLARFSAELQEIENHLPIDPAMRNPTLGALAPIRVVNEVFAAGDANRAVQLAAFNLPNDERITKEKGAKRVMVKNVQEAKFNVVLRPIAQAALAAADRKSVVFEAFFTQILMHELMHGLGPHQITVNGRASTVRQELRDTYSAIEEAKADISGLFALQFLIDKGVIDRSLEKTIYITFLASAFRSIRFGITEAHGKGVAMQLNYLLDAGAVGTTSDGTFFVEPAKIKQAVTALTRELLTIEGRGDREKAREILEKRAVVRPAVQKVLDHLSKVPVDIEPKFVTAEKLAHGRP